MDMAWEVYWGEPSNGIDARQKESSPPKRSAATVSSGSWREGGRKERSRN